MRRIVINEQDLTLSNNPELLTDIVFIPGFSTADDENAAPFLVPKYCANLDEFYTLFGRTAPVFAADQNYVPADWSNANAIPAPIGESDTSVMFAASSPDPGYIFAVETLTAGLPIVYCRCNEDDTDITVDDMYTQLAELFNASTSPLLDKNELNVKYLTSGGYPNFERTVDIAELMIALASKRGDCVALIDHTNNPDRDLTGDDSVYASFTESVDSSYAAMFTPWYNTGLSKDYGIVGSYAVPGSFGYIKTLATSLRTNANWLAIAGVARGKVPSFISLAINGVMTNTIAESYTNATGVSINPITNIRPYGYCIWGNKTGLDAGTGKGFATSFLNIRNLVSDVKKQAYVAAKSCLFEQNTDILWVNFKSLIMPLLDQMVSGSGLKSYKIVKLPGSDREVVRAKIVLVPVYAVEQFVIDIAITDQAVEVDEEE